MLSARNDPLLTTKYPGKRFKVSSPYKIQITQELRPRDYQKRLNFATRFFAACKTPETLSTVMNSTVKRAHCCLINNGGHLIDTVFHTLESPISI